MKRYWRIGVAVVSAALGACAPADDAVFSTFMTASNAAGQAPAEFAMGEPITFEAITLNQTGEAQPVTWCDGSRMDIQVYDASGNLVWNRYYSMAFTQAVQSDSFAPHEERTTQAVWEQDGNGDNPTIAVEVPPGNYYAIATGCASDSNGSGEGFTSPRVDFVIN